MLQDLNKESLLLLYAADELSPRERAEVDQLLAADADLRLHLESLEGTISGFESQMALVDGETAPVTNSLAVRKIGQAMRQHIAGQLARSARKPDVAHSRMRYPWWAYPSVGAAVVLIAFISWWGNRPDQPLRFPADQDRVAGVPASQAPTDEASQLAEGIQKNFAASNLTQPEKSVASLDAAEEQIAELSRTQSDFRYSGGNE